MQKKFINSLFFVFIVCCSLLVASCQTPKKTPAPDLNWQVAVSKFEIKDSLAAVEGVTQYDGSILNVTHTQTPDSGKVYLILEATVSKVGNQSDPFDWQWLVVKDSAGNSYSRMENDSFLDQYQFSPRITGLELRLGEYSGWMCFEIPAAAAKAKLTLTYTAAGSQQEIVLQK
jgi:hypothetical protein